MSNGSAERALSKWRGSGLRECTLPSGTRVQVTVPAPEALMRDPRVPQHLRVRALKFATIGWQRSEVTEADMQEILELQAHMAARTLRGVWDEEAGAFVPVALDPAQLDTLELPPDDVTALEGIGLRRQTPNQVTAQSLLDLGLISPAEAKQVVDEEAGGTVDAYGPFRLQQGGADPRADGADVRAAPERDAGDRRPSGGVGG